MDFGLRRLLCLALTLGASATARAEGASCDPLAESLRATYSLSTLQSLAACHEKEGRLATAMAEYTELATKAAQAKQKKLESAARARMKALEPKVSLAAVFVAQPCEGLEVTFDGTPLPPSAWGTFFPLDPGEHDLQAQAPGRVSWKGSLTVEIGIPRSAIEVPPLAQAVAAPAEPAHAAAEPPAKPEAPKPAVSDEVPAPPPAKPPPSPAVQKRPRQEMKVLTTAPEPTSRSGTPRLVLGGTLAGIGVVGLGAAAVLGVLAKSYANDRDDLCPRGEWCFDQKAFHADHNARLSQQWAFVSAAAGVVAAAGGAWLLLASSGESPSKTDTGDRRDDSKEPDRGSGDAESLWLAPSAAPRSLGLTLGGHF